MLLTSRRVGKMRLVGFQSTISKGLREPWLTCDEANESWGLPSGRCDYCGLCRPFMIPTRRLVGVYGLGCDAASRKAAVSAVMWRFGVRASGEAANLPTTPPFGTRSRLNSRARPRLAEKRRLWRVRGAGSVRSDIMVGDRNRGFGNLVRLLVLGELPRLSTRQRPLCKLELHPPNVGDAGLSG